MSKRNANLLIEDILEAIEKILSYTHGMQNIDFIADSKTIDAVVRNFEIIGEAANHLPENICKINQEIDWRRIVGLRNRIVHNYFGIDVQIVWNIIETDLESFQKQLSDLQKYLQNKTDK